MHACVRDLEVQRLLAEAHVLRGDIPREEVVDPVAASGPLRNLTRQIGTAAFSVFRSPLSDLLTISHGVKRGV